MFSTEPSAVPRDIAEALLAQGAATTADIVRGIVCSDPDLAFSTQCCPITCSPDAEDDGCFKAQTLEERLVGWSAQGWAERYRVQGEIRLNVHDWSTGSPRLVEPLYEAGEPSAFDALCSITSDATDDQHVQHFEQRFWLMANLIVVTTATERHPVRAHTITPGTPRVLIRRGRPA